ncbi:MAG: hypothetical protein WCG78_08090, partial [Candidatus Omnitrophota bacterium]
YALDHDWSFMSRFSFSPVLADAIDNSDSGRIKGKGGYLFNANLGFDYRLTEYSSIAFGGFMELQHLKGNTRDAAIWPTNDTNSYGIFVAMNGFWGAGTRSVRSARQEEPVVRQVAVPAQPARVMPARPSARVELVCAPETVTYDPGDYYEEVRKKIASCVAGMSKLDKGETQLHLTLAADGAIEKVYAIDETSTTGAVTKQAIVQAVTALTPFPALPKELKKNKISMIVPVVVS